MVDKDSEWGQRKEQFFQLWSYCQKQEIDHDVLEKIWQQLTDYYSESHRYYHTRGHIIDCLEFYDKIKERLSSPEAVEMSIWYHDVIYDTMDRNNEEKSAELFQLHANGYFTDGFIKRVTDLILATTHSKSPIDQDAAYLQDIDLCSFGETWGNFLLDGDNLRKESPHLSDDQYYDGKIVFFQMLLNRERIYFSDYFYNCYEETARRNINVMMHKIIDPEA